MQQKNTTLVIIAMGSNLGDSYQYLLSAEQHLIKIPQCEQFCFSSIYQTVAIGENNAPDYLNATASFSTSLTPHELLEKLLAIEIQHERTRSHKNAPRTLDLDIIFYGNKTISDKTLILPHPRMHERFFVLTPLTEIHPAFKHPQFNKTVEQLETELKEKHPKENYITLTDMKFLSTP